MASIPKNIGVCPQCNVIPCQCGGSKCGGCGKPKFTQCTCLGPFSNLLKGPYSNPGTFLSIGTTSVANPGIFTQNVGPGPPIVGPNTVFDFDPEEGPPKMTPSQYFDLACLCMTHRFTLMVVGMPGGGKTEITVQASEYLNRELIITHPVIDDPTNYKGFPFKEVDANGNIRADFVPFGMLRKLMEADKPTTMFMDDMGQAPKATQAAAMQLLWGGKLNGAQISEHVSFVVATNRREDKAAVTGMIEPLKNRATIVQLDTNVDDWCKWAIKDSQPPENIAFNRFRTNFLLDGYEATLDFTNSATPRTIAKCGDLLKAGLPKNIELEVYEGTAGKQYATEFTSFLKHYRKIPDIQGIINNPKKAKVPDEASILYATCECLATQATKANFDNIMIFADKLHEEFEMMLVRDAVAHNEEICKTDSFIQWQAKNQDIILFTGQQNAP